MSSLYAKYIREREGKEIIETDDGFATYQIFDNGECYLQDIYIVPEKRNSGLATEIANKVSEIAKERGCNLLIGSVCVDDKCATRNMKVLLAYDMQVYKTAGTMIFLRKQIGEQ